MADARVVWSGVLERRGEVAGLSGCAGTGSSLRAGLDLAADERVMTARAARQIAGDPSAGGARLGKHRRAGGGRGRSFWRDGGVPSFAVGDE